MGQQGDSVSCSPHGSQVDGGFIPAQAPSHHSQDRKHVESHISSLSEVTHITCCSRSIGLSKIHGHDQFLKDARKCRPPVSRGGEKTAIFSEPHKPQPRRPAEDPVPGSGQCLNRHTRCLQMTGNYLCCQKENYFRGSENT